MTKAMKNRTGSGISAPNRLSNIAPPCALGGRRTDKRFGAPDQESPEWLTPAAIFAVLNPNKVLRKPVLRTTLSTRQKDCLGKRRINGKRPKSGVLTAC
jgi:hypothetical protein